MDVIWNSKEALDLEEIIQTVNSKFDHDWKPQIVSTFVARLNRNGFIELKNHHYSALIKASEYKAF